MRRDARRLIGLFTRSAFLVRKAMIAKTNSYCDHASAEIIGYGARFRLALAFRKRTLRSILKKVMCSRIECLSQYSDSSLSLANCGTGLLRLAMTAGARGPIAR